MSKRAPGLERVKGDFYRTWDPRTVAPLLPFLEPGTEFLEPCAGDGILADHLERAGHRCVWASDLEPKPVTSERHPGRHWAPIGTMNALEPTVKFYTTAAKPGRRIITNPPWTRSILHPLIPLWGSMAPTWLLFDADWAHTAQAVPFLPYCQLIVSVGRVKWIQDSKHVGKDNAAWYLFDYEEKAPGGGPTFMNLGKDK